MLLCASKFATAKIECSFEIVSIENYIRMTMSVIFWLTLINLLYSGCEHADLDTSSEAR